MRVIRIENIPEIPRATFKDAVRIKTLIDKDVGASDFKIAILTFQIGARSDFHTHTFDQVHIVLSGKGIIADEKQEVIFTEGMVAFIPAGERHWHGAAEDSEFSHLSIMGSDALYTIA